MAAAGLQRNQSIHIARRSNSSQDLIDGHSQDPRYQGAPHAKENILNGVAHDADQAARPPSI